MPEQPEPQTDIATYELFNADRFVRDVTDLRVHTVALQRWFNRSFVLREGYPCPVIFAGPMDAYASFNRLWKEPNNPYAYLAQLRDQPGLEPGPLRFPLISVDFKRMRYRPEQSYASRVDRHIRWVTTSPPKDGVMLNDLANVVQARRAAAWTFSWQIDFWCARPSMQAIFIKQLTNCFKVMSAGSVQTFIPVVYPNYYGALSERLILSSEIDDMTEKESNEKEMQRRTSFTLELEGYAIDSTLVVAPALWIMIIGNEAVAPADVQSYFDLHGIRSVEDLRLTRPIRNAVLMSRDSLPPDRVTDGASI